MTKRRCGFCWEMVDVKDWGTCCRRGEVAEFDARDRALLNMAVTAEANGLPIPPECLKPTPSLAELRLSRNSDPATSKASGEVVRPHLGKIQRLVLDVFEVQGPMTARKAERLPEFEDYGFSTIRKRISELAAAGMLLATGVDRSGRSPATIYDHNQNGREDIE